MVTAPGENASMLLGRDRSCPRETKCSWNANFSREACANPNRDGYRYDLVSLLEGTYIPLCEEGALLQEGQAAVCNHCEFFNTKVPTNKKDE